MRMSSNDIAIRVSNLSKCYQIYETPRDRLKQFVMPQIRRMAGKPNKNYFREFWALKDVSLEIKKGETVGIIGRNGSGKSTLLQLICGTLTPTNGSIETRGRIAALLELGSGFNPEFTGRENVYMNASVLGLTNEEIKVRFDDIVAFSGIEDFIEQPVKTYSSGMMVRLAFAVIANVDADILVIDEALAVGDAVFTQKCMRFIRSFQKHGTLIFVSHDTSSVQNLCKSSLWLHHGKVEQSGSSKNVVEGYLKYTLQEVYGDIAKLSETKPINNSSNISLEEVSDIGIVDYESRALVQENILDASGWETGVAEIISISLTKFMPDSINIFAGGEKVRLIIRAKANEILISPILGFVVKDRLGQVLFGENTLPHISLLPRQILPGQKFTGEFVFKLPMLPDGQYPITASVAEGDYHNNIQHHYLHDALIINVYSSKIRWGLMGIQFESIALEVQND